MARRATIFKQTKAVRIGGGNEFAPPGSEENMAPEAVAKLKQVADLLNYDIFMLSPADMRVLHTAHLNASKNWLRPATKPRLVVKTVPQGTLAFVIFPDQGQADPQAESALLHFARNLRKQGKYNLLIGLSTWGADREEQFLQGNEPVFDIVLGSGEGPGYSGIFLHDNQVLWMRAFTKGKNLLSLTLPALPAPGSKVAWQPETSVTTTVLHLGDAIPSDQQIIEIFNH